MVCCHGFVPFKTFQLLYTERWDQLHLLAPRVLSFCFWGNGYTYLHEWQWKKHQNSFRKPEFRRSQEAVQILTGTHEPQDSGVAANGKITLYPKVQDPHPKVRGHTIFPLSSTSLLGFGYTASKSAWPGRPGLLWCPSLQKTRITSVLHQPGSYGSSNVFFINIKWSTINSHFPHLPGIFPNLLSPNFQFLKYAPKTIFFSSWQFEQNRTIISSQIYQSGHKV